jgi:flavorubredoxin
VTRRTVAAMNATLTVPAKTRLEPTKVANETYLIHDHAGEGQGPVAVALNSMVIRGAEPVVVDTGMAENREQFLADVFSLVEPKDIRWLFISHDDVDHTGNLNALMEAAPNATVIVNWFMTERMGASLDVSPLRQRWVGDGELIDVGDRKLLTIRPPVFDAGTTRGVFDTTTGVYWASDSFAAPMITPVRNVADIDADFWFEGMMTFNQYVAPWITLTDEAKFGATVDRIEALGASYLVGCHTPVIGRDRIDQALAATRRSPFASVEPQPDQAVLEQIQRTLLVEAN